MPDRSEAINAILAAVDAVSPDPVVIGQAAATLRRGGLVAFPTETVYGLGACGLDPSAVARIFEVKGRPAEKGLILHLAQLADLTGVVQEIPPVVEALYDQFAPGPLTLVLRASDQVPDNVKGGGDTVAVRWPAHPVSVALILAVGTPVAAPSANLSGQPPPRTAEEVVSSFNGRIEMVLDAGPTPLGVPSTLLDLTGEVPRILREGPVGAEELWRILKN